MKWISYVAMLVLGIAIGFLGASLKVGSELAGADLPQSNELTAKRVAELEEQVSQLEKSLAEKNRAEAAAAAVAEAGSTAGGSTKGAASKGGGEGGFQPSMLAEMMDNPVMKEQIKQQFKGQIGTTYANLFKDQGFQDDEVAALSDILVERQLAITQAAMGAMAGGGMADKEKREEVGSNVEAVMESYNEELKALLGEAKFREFKRFEETQAERQQLESLRGQLASTDHPLSPDAEQKLMDVMWEVREDPQFESGSEVSKVMAGTAMPDDPEAIVSAFGEMQAEVRNRAQTFLAPEQIEALETNQRAFLDMMEMGLKMSAQMIGGGGGEE